MLKDLPFDTIGLRGDDVQTLEDTYSLLCSKFSIGLPGDTNLHLNNFELFCNNPDLSIGGILLLNHDIKDCYLAFIKIHYHSVNTRTGGEDIDYYKYKVWAFITSKNDFGRILIRKETFADRVLQLVHPVELKFKDDTAFNHKFYVVTNDEQKALNAMNWNFRNVVMDMANDLMIETANHVLVIGDNKEIDPQNVVYLAGFANKIAALK